MKDVEIVNVVASLMIPAWCGWVAGVGFFFAAQAASGKKSAASIFRLLEEKT